MIPENKILRKRCVFLYGGKWYYRLRMTTHSADRLKERSANENQTVVEYMKSLANILERTTALADLEKPKSGASIMFYIEERNEMVVIAIAPLAPNPARKNQDIEGDAIIETYLLCSSTYFTRIRSSARDRCIAILRDGNVVEGKHNKWFV